MRDNGSMHLSPSLTIRSFHSNDQDQVIRLWGNCQLVVPHNDPVADIARKIADSGEVFLVGEREDMLIATVMAGYEGHRGWINYLAVAPELQATGIGRRMMAAAEERLVALGCARINLQVRATNAGVIAFYEKLAYSVDNVVSLGKRLVP